MGALSCVFMAKENIEIWDLEWTGLGQELSEERQQITNIEKTAGELGREVSRAGLGLAGVEQSLARKIFQI